ncbi:hypothetical protein CK203_046038 [Vitis vinifera]|uniref:Uncharacterized protein n=1 Tax=Vitis vinifera TaxID=29760 RepID=A0A438HGS3_VITVI|nr:hypothetical protein CK203_046038 [Vitis vinifera]
MAPSHRKETVGKRKTTESSPPGDRKIERRKRCLRIQASTSGPPRRQRSRGQVANSRPQQEPESIYPGTTGAIPGACNRKDNVIKNPVVKFDARKTRPTRAWKIKATNGHNWAPRPDPMATPMVQNVHPHRDPVVTPVMRNVHSHPAEQPTGRNIPNGHPLAPSAKGWMTCSPRLSALISLITSPQGDSSYQNFPHTMEPTIPSITSCIIDSS